MVLMDVHKLAGYENVLPIYKIGDDGEVYSNSKTKCGRPLKQHVNERGYHLLGLKTICGSKKYQNALVHRLVALAFVVGYQSGLQVDHCDGNKDKNIPSNLKWTTPLENTSNPITFGKFIEANRRSHNAKQIVVEDIETGKMEIYPSMCVAARAIGYKSNSFNISKTKGYRTVGKYKIMEVIE